MHWLRCRIDDKTRHGSAATTYSQAPEIYSLTAAPVGALLPASHAAQEENEIRGIAGCKPSEPIRSTQNVRRVHRAGRERLARREPQLGRGE